MVIILSLTSRLPPSAGAGISFFRSGVDNIVGVNSDEFFTGDMGYSEGYIMLSFGVDLHKFLSFGLNGKSLFQRYHLSNDEKYISRGVSLDFGLSSSLSDKVNIGIQLESMFGGYNWNQSISSNSIPYKEKIPTRIIGGFSYKPIDQSLILLQLETILIPDGYLSKRLSLGIEFSFDIIDKFKPILLRMGLEQSRWLNDTNGVPSKLVSPSAGIGIEFKIFNKISLNLDYALDVDNTGINNLFSFRTEL